MVNLVNVAVVLATFLLNGCQPSQPFNVLIEENKNGMKRCASKGQSAILGSGNAATQADERPQCQVKFTYDFYIDSTEVTLAEYNRITGGLPKEYVSSPVVDSQCPVCYVSWNDAVLFCNAKSKQNNLDTVYSYYAQEKTPSGIVLKLNGLKSEFQKNGYRLPTEAEWVFAARRSSVNEFVWGNGISSDSISKNAWYIGNADKKTHPVATLVPNINGLYDMAGNVAEWVTDTKETFDGKVRTDFTGGKENATGTKILKGGSFALDVVNLRVASRADPYPLDAVTRSRYIGFRCVLGTIKHPSVIDYDTMQDSVGSIKVIVRSLLSVAGTNEAKLAFVNKTGQKTRVLCIVDYSKLPLKVQQFPDVDDVFMPVISPDGKWVAWANKDEGALSGGAVFVRSLGDSDLAVLQLPDSPAFVPRWHIDPARKDTFIVYVSSAQMNDQVSWGSSQTKKIRFSSGAFSGLPVVIDAQGSYHGGISADETYLVTGYPLLRTKNIPQGKEKTLFYPPFDGKKGEDPSQVCNVSISPEMVLPPQILFLDFGSGRDKSTLTGDVYDSHEYIFRCDSNGVVVNYYPVPNPYKSWNHVEWSSHPKYAVACAVTTEGLSRLVCIVNLETSACYSVCEGTDLYHPDLWLSNVNDSIVEAISLDSIGQYDNPHITYQQSWAAKKLRMFWQHASTVEVVAVGTSVVADGINSAFVKDFKTINMGIVSGDQLICYEIVEHYLLPHAPKLKAVVVSFDAHTYLQAAISDAAYTTLLQSKGYIYDKNHSFWVEGVSPLFTSIISSVPLQLDEASEGLRQTDSLGYTLCACYGWGPAPPPVIATIEAGFDTSVYHMRLNVLQSMINSCSEKGVKLLLVNFPLHPGYAATPAYGAYGPSRKIADKMIEDLKDIDKNEEDMVFYDANIGGKHDYTKSQFVDHSHLCSAGAEKMSIRVDSLLLMMEKE